MQEPKSSGNTRNPNYTLLLFKPRQVILAEQISGTKMAKKDHNQSTKYQSADRKTILIHSMLRYLETIGFSKTLKRLLSEAQVQDDNWRTSSVDLEDMCSKYLETCDKVDAKSNTSKEQESRTNGFITKDEESDHVASEKTISKKKKMNIDDSEDKLANDKVAELEVKPKEKKKSKRVSDSDGQTEQTSPEALTKPADDTVSELEMDESNKKHKDKKKKKKSTLNSESIDGNLEKQQLEPLQRVTEDKSKDFVSSEGDGKLKDKKKKRKGVTTDTLVTEEQNVESKDIKRKKEASVSGDVVELVDKENPASDSTKEILQASEDAMNKEKTGSKKRKRLETIENEHQSVEEVVIEDSKRQKTENLDEIKTTDEPSNEKLEKNGEEKSASQKSKRKQLNDSAEPKTVNAFQRVKIDCVEFANEKLQDNSYWAKGGAEVGYGAKAQEILGQVRGRDFRHEKTKKKRGSYRGGNIDLHSHSVKFNYSDED